MIQHLLPARLPPKSGLSTVVAQCRTKLWKALKNSVHVHKKQGWRTEVNAINEFNLDPETIEALGDRPLIVLNRQEIKVDFNLHEAIYEVIEDLGRLEEDDFVKLSYNANPCLNSFMSKVEKMFLEYALTRNRNKSETARKLKISRQTLTNRCKLLGIKINK